MEQLVYINFISGMCFMFYSMMAWFFWRKGPDRLSRLVMVLMAIIAVQCLKDVFFLPQSQYTDSRTWSIVTAVDMVAVPFYAFILTELCSPGRLTRRSMVLQLLPVVLLPALFICTGVAVFYYCEVVWVAVYGVGVAIRTIFAIRRYNVLVHEQFSYDENINLGWLRIILVFFFLILSLWVADSLVINIDLEAIYMLGSLIMWIFLAYFICRHENVVSELRALIADEPAPAGESQLAAAIRQMFEADKIYLRRNLKLGDIAMMAGSNRTYVSRYFNDELGCTFFDYVNGLRISHAKKLLCESDAKLDVIAANSGFGSREVLHRVFSKFEGTTPEKFRAENRGH